MEQRVPRGRNWRLEQTSVDMCVGNLGDKEVLGRCDDKERNEVGCGFLQKRMEMVVVTVPYAEADGTV